MADVFLRHLAEGSTRIETIVSVSCLIARSVHHQFHIEEDKDPPLILAMSALSNFVPFVM
jgi:hypothetical protein